MPLTVDPDGLAADGAELAYRYTIDEPAVLGPAGADSVSVAVTAQLSAHSASLAVLLNHAQKLRTVGGAVTQHVAASMRATDEAAADVIAGKASMSAAVTMSATSTLLSAPMLPAIPPMPPPATIPGEAQAVALYAGPGAASLRQFAEDWQSRASALDNAAAETSQTGASIDAHWSDGIQRAGAITKLHGTWSSDKAGQVRVFAFAANDVADQYDRAIAATPSPLEFTDAHTQLSQLNAANVASRGMLSSQVSAAAARLARLQSQATDAATAYYTAAVTTMSSIAKTLAAAPAIAAGSGSAPTATHSKTTAASTGSGNGTATSNADGATSDSGTDTSDAATNSAALQQLATGLLPAAAMLPMAPMSALSGLSGLMRPSSPTATGQLAGQSGAATDLATPGEAGDSLADTSPASSPAGGAETASERTPAPPAPRASPPSASAVSGPTASVGFAATGGVGTAPAAAEGSAMSSSPPMMGAPGAADGGSQRDLRLFPDRQLVARQVPNSEAVFGELRRERRSRVKRAAPREESDEGQS